MSYRELLYDAEIEYLQGDGYAYLSLMPIKELSPDVANWSIDWMKRVSGIHVFGGMHTNNMQLVSNYNTFRFDWCKHSSLDSVNINANTRYSLVQEDGYLKINNVSKECTKNITQTTRFFLFTKNPRESNTQFKGNIYGMKVWSRSTGHILYDFIPVRKGNVGYFFDKVSLKLYGNVGGGAFILGPDVAPAAYANEVAFLESWGGQYIDTGIMPSTDTKIELKCLYCKSGAGLTNYGALIGADDRSNAYILNHSAVANFTYGLEFSNNFANPQTRLLTFDSTARPHNMRVYDEGGSLVTTLTCIRGVFEVNQNLYLFAVNRGGTPVYGSNRILYCKIYDGDTLVRDYVPVEYNGIGYMYDKVSGLFFGNQGTGKFLFGSIVNACVRSYTRRQCLLNTENPPHGYEWADYIENTSSAYINTQLKGKQTLKVDAHWLFKTSAVAGIMGASYNHSPDNALLYRANANSTSYFYYGNSWGGTSALTLNKKWHIVIDKGKLYYDDVLKRTLAATGDSTYNFMLFKVADFGTCIKGQLFDCKIYDNGILVRNYKPAKRLSDNKYGLWDKVGGKFYASASSANFVGG